jgi:ADP-ribosylglycohydrolase
LTIEGNCRTLVLRHQQKAATMSELATTRLVPGLIYEQIAGALLGAAVGDALGWPYEQNAGRVGPRSTPSPIDKYQGWRRRLGGRFATHELAIQPGAYSDDTQLLLATARALLTTPQWAVYLGNYELPLWLCYERGGGGATKRAAESWQRQTSPWTNSKLAQRYFQAGGNGVAMRILPHLFVPNQSASQLMRDVLRNGILTHGHPRAILGARLYALAGWWIAHQREEIPYGELITAMLAQEDTWAQPPDQLSGPETNSRGWLESANQYFSKGYVETWRLTVNEIHYGLRRAKETLAEGMLANHEEILRELGCFGSENGSGVVAALAAIYLFSAHAANPMIGLRTIAYAQRADTDTIASMLGGLFGLSHRIEWIPEQLREVQDRALLEQLAMRFASSDLNHQQQPQQRWRASDEQAVVDKLQQGAPHVRLGVLGAAEVVYQRPLLSLKDDLPGREWELKTEVGQTVFITHTPRKSASRLDERRRTPDRRIPQDRGKGPVSRQQMLPEVDELFQEPVSEEPIWPDRGSELARNAIADLLDALAKLVGREVSADSVLQLAAHIFRTPPTTRIEARNLVDRFLPNLAEAQRHACARVIEQHLA